MTDLNAGALLFFKFKNENWTTITPSTICIEFNLQPDLWEVRQQRNYRPAVLILVSVNSPSELLQERF